MNLGKIDQLSHSESDSGTGGSWGQLHCTFLLTYLKKWMVSVCNWNYRISGATTLSGPIQLAANRPPLPNATCLFNLIFIQEKQPTLNIPETSLLGFPSFLLSIACAIFSSFNTPFSLPKRWTSQTPFVAPEPCEVSGYLFYFQHTISDIYTHTHITHMKTLKRKRILFADKGYYYGQATYIKSKTGRKNSKQPVFEYSLTHVCRLSMPQQQETLFSSSWSCWFLCF